MTGLKYKERKHIAVLQRRMQHLRERIGQAPLDKSMDWDKRELGALRWVIERVYGLQESVGTEKGSKRSSSEKP